MVRFTIDDLVDTRKTNPDAIYIIGEVEQPQPTTWLHYFDPFDGMGDFEIHPDMYRLYSEARLCHGYRDQWATALDRAECAEAKLANVVAILDRPLSKLPKKDLIVLIRAAQDALADAKEQMG